jgi:F-type H+-transporting ATPase subunit a
MTVNPFEHVLDQVGHWHIFKFLFGGWSIPLPNILGFQITKYMLLELIVAVLLMVIFIPLCRRAAKGELPNGPWWNAFEVLLTFIRDDVAKPNLGEHEADPYVPFLWTQFLFILFCNLLGLFPFLGSPTASIAVTGALAVFSLVLMHAVGIAKMGGLHYLKSLWPHIEVPEAGIFMRLMMIPIGIMIFGIELMSTVIRSFVLAVRLFANMFAGHMVLGTILLFIVIVGEAGISWAWGAVTVASVLGVVALSLLELFVAFLQAYIFTFLTALFMGMSMHPSH